MNRPFSKICDKYPPTLLIPSPPSIRQICLRDISSVVKPKDESQNGFKKTKHAKFYEKQTFLIT